MLTHVEEGEHQTEERGGGERKDIQGEQNVLHNLFFWKEIQVGRNKIT